MTPFIGIMCAHGKMSKYFGNQVVLMVLDVLGQEMLWLKASMTELTSFNHAQENREMPALIEDQRHCYYIIKKPQQ